MTAVDAQPPWVLALFVLVIRSPALGTTVVVHRTCDAVSIGADSRAIGVNAPCVSVCKLIPCGADFIAASTGLRETSTFNLPTLIERACRERTTLPDVVHRLFELLAAVLREGNVHAPTSDDGGADFWVVFAGIEGGKPTYITVEAKQVGNGTQLNVEPAAACTPGNYDGIAGGRIQAINGVRQVATETDGVYVLRLLGIEAADTDEVGPPFDLLRIDGSGKHWLHRKEECPE